MRIAGVETCPHSRPQSLVEVEAHGLPLESSVLDDAAIVLNGPRGEVLRVLGTARNACTGLEGQGPLPGQLVFEIEERASTARQGAEPFDEPARRRVPGYNRSERAECISRVAEGPRPHLVREPEEPDTLREADLRHTCLPPLRLDDDHTVRRLLAVDGSSRCAAQDLDALD